MSAISLKSITGITSITTPAGADNQLTLHTNNTTEAVKLDTAGNLHFHNHLNITGVSSASNFKTGSTNVHSTGVELANINTGGGTATFGGGITVAGAIDANGDLDVDGHTNLDNLNVAGVSTHNDHVQIIDGKRLKVGSADNGDLILLHTGTDSIIDNATGNLFYRSATHKLQALNAEDMIVCNTDGAVDLYHNNVLKLSTASHGATLTGNLRLPDNTSGNASIQLGDSQDFFMNHNGTHSYIINNTGNLYIRDLNGDVHIQGKDNEESIIAKADGAVELYHNNTKRLETSSVGVSIPQDLDVDGHTNLDNVSVAGVTTFTGNANFGSNGYISGSANFSLSSNKLRVTGSDTVGIECQRAGNATIQCTDTSNSTDLQLRANSTGGLVRTATNKALNLGTFQKNRIQITNDGKVQIGLPGSSTSLPGGVEVVNIRAMTDGNLHIRAIGSISGAPSGSGIGIDVLNDASNAVKDLALRGSTVIFKRASAETLRIDTSGRALFSGTLGYGNMPFGGNPSNAAIQIRCNSKYNGIAFGENAVSGAIGLGGDDTSTAMVFTANAHPANLGGGTKDIFEWWSGNAGGGGPGKYMTLDTGGHLALTSGNLEFANGSGIDFSAAADIASGETISSSVLDDYEEGSWTAADASGASLSVANNNNGKYTKIGRMVILTFDITYPSTSNTNISRVTSPFAASTGYGNGWVGWTELGRPMQIHISGTNVYFMDNNTGGTGKHLYNNELSGKRFIGGFIVS